MKQTWAHTHYVNDVVSLDNRDYHVVAEVTVIWAHDAHYGADADGNRGIAADFEDERTYAISRVGRYEGDEIVETLDVATLSPRLRLLLETYLEHLEIDYDPDDRENDQDEDD